MNEKEEKHITVGDGFRFGIGMFLSSLILWGLFAIIIWLVMSNNGYTFYW